MLHLSSELDLNSNSSFRRRRAVCGRNPTAEAGCRSERRRSRWPAGRAAGCGEFIQHAYQEMDSGSRPRRELVRN